jgi:hypothetical protein
MMTFRFSLCCLRCTTVLTFEDERPSWKTYDYRVECSDDLEAAARFVQRHADDDVPDFSQDWPALKEIPETAWEFMRPHRVPSADDSWSSRIRLYVPASYRYVDCPVCDTKIREPQR